MSEAEFIRDVVCVFGAIAAIAISTLIALGLAKAAKESTTEEHHE